MSRHPRSRQHLVVPPPEENVDYKSPGQNRDNRERRVFDGSRRPHAASLRRQYEDAAEQWDDRNSRTITFTTFPGALDILAQLDSRKTRGPHIELLSATATGDKDDAVLTASVYIPESQESWFLRKLDDYVAQSRMNVRVIAISSSRSSRFARPRRGCSGLILQNAFPTTELRFGGRSGCGKTRT